MNKRVIKKFNDFEVVNESKKTHEVFLGGTCNDSKWREELIQLLECNYFNPVVEDWNEEAQQLEIEKRETCDYVLYVITPKMTGVYSIAELTYDACISPNKTIFCYLTIDEENIFEEHQIKSLEMTKKLIEKCNANVFENLNEVANFLNNL